MCMGTGYSGRVFNIRPNGAIGNVDGIAFLAERKGKCTPGQGARCPSGGPMNLNASIAEIVRGKGRAESALPTSLRSKPDHPPQNEKRIFPAFYHPRKPVECRVWIGTPHGFVEGTYQVIVHLTFFYRIRRCSSDRASFTSAWGDFRFFCPRLLCHPVAQVKQIEGFSRVPRWQGLQFPGLPHALPGERLP